MASLNRRKGHWIIVCTLNLKYFNSSTFNISNKLRKQPSSRAIIPLRNLNSCSRFCGLTPQSYLFSSAAGATLLNEQKAVWETFFLYRCSDVSGSLCGRREAEHFYLVKKKNVPILVNPLRLQQFNGKFFVFYIYIFSIHFCPHTCVRGASFLNPTCQRERAGGSEIDRNKRKRDQDTQVKSK